MATLATARRNGNGSRLAVPAAPAAIACAVYTRKSTDEGLDSDFSSLDAQREACELYIGSMKSEGWTLVPDRYDDGAQSGGTLDRPALRRLITDITAGRVGCVVVHRIDRLSRSLLDFARLMELFEHRGVAVVSITQRLDSSTSMGRLTLNMLLSFAQFEREIIGERTRDKIRAAKRRGKWCGGTPLYGFDIIDKKLVPNPIEAARARQAFEIYLETGSLIATAKEMNDRGWTTKALQTKNGPAGARPWNKGVLHGLLTNPTLVGRVVTGGQSYRGEHEAIIDHATFDAVQERLAANAVEGSSGARYRSEALLVGILKCSECGSTMTPSFCRKGPRVYRYYRCSKQVKQGAKACRAKHVNAEKIESRYVAEIARRARDPRVVAAVVEATREALDAKKKAVADEARAVNRAIKDCERERLGLDDPASVARMDARLAEYRARLDELRADRVALGGVTIDSDEIAALLAGSFDQVWAQMTSRERRRVVELLHPRV